MYTCVYIYIYIQRERERDWLCVIKQYNYNNYTYHNLCIDMYMHICIHTCIGDVLLRGVGTLRYLKWGFEYTFTNYNGDHTNPPHPHKSDLIQFDKLKLQWTSSVLCVFSKFLHLINPNWNLLNRGGGGGVGLCGPSIS